MPIENYLSDCVVRMLFRNYKMLGEMFLKTSQDFPDAKAAKSIR